VSRIRPQSLIGLPLALILVALMVRPSRADSPTGLPIECQELRRYDAPEATQAAAVDAECFYAIGNRVIAKYAKDLGRQLAVWSAPEGSPIEHLNSGVVRGGKLYCAHSNFPNYPEISSVEIWDTQSLRHVDSHSFGIDTGSLTWIDWRDDAWWAVFAHYTEKVNDDPLARDTRWTSLVRFDKEWRRTAGWVFPGPLLERFKPHSSSGGGWDTAGRLFCSGHDRGELYEIALPDAGSTLTWRATYSLPITGQGFAWDPSQPGVLYGIDRPKRQVVVVRLPEGNAEQQATKAGQAQPR
jgi:hypothetical protein